MRGDLSAKVNTKSIIGLVEERGSDWDQIAVWSLRIQGYSREMKSLQVGDQEERMRHIETDPVLGNKQNECWVHRNGIETSQVKRCHQGLGKQKMIRGVGALWGHRELGI